MTPKSLLRHKMATSTLEDLSGGQFEPVIDEIDALDADKARRVILCSGKVYYDLLAKRRELGIDDISIVRIEQLYPFPYGLLGDAVAAYPNAQDCVWCQEEPRNQGAWYNIKHRLERITGERNLRFAGRPASPAPAVGYHSRFAKQQHRLVMQALGLDPEE